MRHLIDPLDFSVEEIDALLDLAGEIERNREKYSHLCDDRTLATLFYEPSTRTRLSFEAAMLNLGGRVLGFASADSSSAAKGESISDTIRVVSCEGRRPKGGIPVFRDPGDQCRRRRTPASHPDTDRPADHSVSERPLG